MDLLKTLLSNTPLPIWFVVASLLVLTGYFLYRLGRETKRYISEFEQATKKLKAHVRLPQGRAASPAEAKQEVAQIGQVFAAQPYLQAAWEHFAVSLVTQAGPVGHVRVWRTSSANEAFSEDSLITERLNKNAYLSAPSIITGIGLLTTFGAILFALLHLKVPDNGLVEGLNPLIEGLSGKFTSSVVALLCATLFIFLEKRWFYELEKSRQQLVKTLDQLFPHLSQVQMLLNLQSELSPWKEHTTEWMDTFRDVVGNAVVRLSTELTREMRSQTKDLQAFSVSLQRTFSESLTPTMNRMANGAEEVNKLMLASEKEKNAKISATVNDLLQEFQDSFKAHLKRIALDFSNLLANRTKEQFDEMDRLFRSTAGLFSDVHTQLVGTQISTRELVDYTHTMTEGQLKVGQHQLRQLEDEWKCIQQMRENLNVTTEKLGASMQNLTDLAASTQLAVETTRHTASTLHLANEQAQTNLQQIVERNANQIASQLAELKDANSRQTAVWQGISASMREYEQVFLTVEKKVGGLLREVTTNLEKYQQVYAQGFQTLNEVSEEHFANATRKLGASVNDLDEHLQNLSEIFERVNGAQPNGKGIKQ